MTHIWILQLAYPKNSCMVKKCKGIVLYMYNEDYTD